MTPSKNTIRRPIIAAFVFAIMDVSFVEVLLVPLLQKLGLLPLMVSIALISRKIARMTTDIPLAIMADKCGIKYVFLLARIVKILAMILLLSSNKLHTVLSMILWGTSLSGLYGKIDTYVYNCLKIHDKTNLFPRIMSIYSGLCQGVIMTTGVLSGIIFKAWGCKALVICTIVLAIFSLIPWCFIPNIKQSQHNQSNVAGVITSVIRNLMQKPHLIKLIVLFATLHMLAWQSGGFMQPALIAAGLSEAQLGLMFSAKAFCMLIGSMLSSFFAISKVPSATSIGQIFLVVVLLMFAVGINFSYIGITLWLLCYAIICNFMQVTIERHLEYYAQNNIRNTITAIATFTASSISITLTFLFGMMAQYYSFRTAYLLNSIIIIAIATWIVVNAKQSVIKEDL